MPRSIKSGLTLGITPTVKHGVVADNNIRAIEYQFDKREARSHAKTTNSDDLCELHELPEGMKCASRKLGKYGFYFCHGGKEGCPLEG